MPTPRSAPPLLDAASRVLRRHRRWLAALAAFVAVYAGLSAVRPPASAGVEVVAAAHDIAPGTGLAASDLVRLRVPPDAVPAGARRETQPLIGATVNVPLPARAIVTDAALEAGQAVARPGHVVLALPMSDAALATLIQPGSRIDLLSPGGKEPVAREVRVLAFPDAKASSALAAAHRAILVEVPAGSAAAVAAAADAGGLVLALH